MKKFYKPLFLFLTIFVTFLLIHRLIILKEINSHKSQINDSYKTQVESDNYDLCNFGDYRFAIRKFNDTNCEEFLYDRKENSILYSNINSYTYIDNYIYIISNSTDLLLKLNYTLENVYIGPLDTFDSYDQEVFKKLQNNKSSTNILYKSIDKPNSPEEITVAYFKEGKIRITKNNQDKYSLIDMKNNKKIDTITAFYVSEFFDTPILYCIGENGYIQIYIDNKNSDIDIYQNSDINNFDSNTKSIFNSNETNWIFLN